ncbi:MAG: hypothetical protein NTY07_18540 [Bacteroidia bacterium]|nr:hypothetical protein [Bacteroidia bacterium]
MTILEEKHKASFLIGLGFVIIGFLTKVIYREYINSHGIDDFGLAGSLPSFLYVIGFSQIFQIRPIKYPVLVILVVTLGSVIYEFKQFRSSGNLDVNDIVASILGGTISYVILILVEKRFKNQDR